MTKQELLDAIEFGDYEATLNNKNLSYDILARNLFPDVTWFFDKQEGTYQGDWYMVGKKDNEYYFFTMAYGSCSGCDWLQSAVYGEPEQQKKILSNILDNILETPTFPSKEAVIEYAKKFDWQNYCDIDENNLLVAEILKAIEAN